MVVRWVFAVIAVVLAVIMGLFTFVIAVFRIPEVLVIFSTGVSSYGLFLIPVALLGAALSLVLFRGGVHRGVRLTAVAAGVVCVIGGVAACFPLVDSWSAANRHRADLSLVQYFTGGSNTGKPDESLSTVYNTADGQNLLLDVKLPAGEPNRPRPAVVWVHGGGWAHGDRGEGPKWHKWLNDKGFAVFSIEYRLSPPPRWDQAPRDVKCAIGWVKQQAARYGVDPDRVLIAGGSAGGNLALMGAYADDRVLPSCAVADTSVKAVAVFYPVPDIAEAWRDTALPRKVRGLAEDYTGGTPDQVPGHYAAASPVTYVRPGLPPTLVMHGTRDHVAPYEGSVELVDRLSEVGVRNELLTVPYGEHAYDFTWGDWGTQISRQVFGDFLDTHFPVR